MGLFPSLIYEFWGLGIGDAGSQDMASLRGHLKGVALVRYWATVATAGYYWSLALRTIGTFLMSLVSV